MRPDRLIIGEIRGEEAFNAIQALNIGLEGMITTIYANSPEEAISRLETYVLASGKEKLKQVIREYIINTIDLIVQIERLSDGKRKIINICEISKDYENEIKLKNIFAFNKKEITDKNHVMGEFVLYKYIPLCYKKMKIRGINTLTDIFDE
jgi:pilus assembly protein CpaF